VEISDAWEVSPALVPTLPVGAAVVVAARDSSAAGVARASTGGSAAAGVAGFAARLSDAAAADSSA